MSGTGEHRHRASRCVPPGAGCQEAITGYRVKFCDGPGQHVLGEGIFRSPALAQVVGEAGNGDDVAPRVPGGAGCLLPQHGEALRGPGAEAQQVHPAVGHVGGGRERSSLVSSSSRNPCAGDRPAGRLRAGRLGPVTSRPARRAGPGPRRAASARSPVPGGDGPRRRRASPARLGSGPDRSRGTLARSCHGPTAAPGRARRRFPGSAGRPRSRPAGPARRKACQVCRSKTITSPGSVSAGHQVQCPVGGEHFTRRQLPLVQAAGFQVTEAERLKAGTVERIHAIKPA
jgi:hypothetical protein